jgi:hypothetical protein
MGDTRDGNGDLVTSKYEMKNFILPITDTVGAFDKAFSRFR